MPDPKKSEVNPIFQYLDKALISNNPLFLNRVNQYLEASKSYDIPITNEEARLLSIVDVLQSSKDNPVEKKPLMLNQGMVDGIRQFGTDMSAELGFNPFNLKAKEQFQIKQNANANVEPSPFKEGYDSQGKYYKYYDAEAVRGTGWQRFWGKTDQNESNRLLADAFIKAGFKRPENVLKTTKLPLGLEWINEEKTYTGVKDIKTNKYEYTDDWWDLYDSLKEDDKLKVQAGLREVLKPVYKSEVERRSKETFVDNVALGIVKGIYNTLDWVTPFPLSTKNLKGFGVHKDLTDEQIALAYEDDIKNLSPEEADKSPIKKSIQDYVDNRNSDTQATLELVGDMAGIILSLGGTKQGWSALGKFENLFKATDRALMLTDLKKATNLLNKTGIISKYALANIGWGMLNPMAQAKMGTLSYYESPYYKENVDTISWENLGLTAYHTVRPGLEQFTEAIFGAEPLRLAKLGIRFNELGTAKGIFKKVGQGILNAIEMPITENIEEEITNMLDEAVYPEQSKQSITLQLIRKELLDRDKDKPYDLRSQKLVTLSTALVALFTKGMTAGMVRKFNSEFGPDGEAVMQEVFRRAKAKGLDEKVLKEVLASMPKNEAMDYERRLITEAKQENQEIMTAYVVGRDLENKLRNEDPASVNEKDFAISKAVDERATDVNPITKTILKGIRKLRGESVYDSNRSTTMDYLFWNEKELDRIVTSAAMKLKSSNRDTMNAIDEMFEKNNNFGLQDKRDIDSLKNDILFSIPTITDTKLSNVELDKYKSLNKETLKTELNELLRKEGVNYATITYKTLVEHGKRLNQFIKTTQDETAKENAVKELEEVDKKIIESYQQMAEEAEMPNTYQHIMLTEILGNTNIELKLNGESTVPVPLGEAERVILGRTNAGKKYIERVIDSLTAISKTFDPTKSRMANDSAIRATKLLASYYYTNKFEKDLQTYEKQLKETGKQKIRDFYKEFPDMIEQDRFRINRTWLNRMLPPNEVNEESYKFFDEISKEIWDGKYNIANLVRRFKDKFPATTLTEDKIKQGIEALKGEITGLKESADIKTKVKTQTNMSPDENAKVLSKLPETVLFAPVFTNAESWEITGDAVLDKEIRTYFKTKGASEKQADLIASKVNEIVQKFTKEESAKAFEIIERIGKLLVATADNQTIINMNNSVFPDYVKVLFDRLAFSFNNDVLKELNSYNKFIKGDTKGFVELTIVPHRDFFNSFYKSRYSMSTKTNGTGLQDAYEILKGIPAEKPVEKPAEQPKGLLIEEKEKHLKSQEIWKRSSLRVKTFIQDNLILYVLREHNFRNPEAYHRMTKDEMNMLENNIKAFFGQATGDDVFSFFFIKDLFDSTGIGDEEYKHLLLSPKIETMLRFYAYTYLKESFPLSQFIADGRHYVIPILDLSTEDRVKIGEKVISDKFKTYPKQATWQQVLDYYGVKGDETLASRLRMIYRQYTWGHKNVNREGSKFLQYHYTFLSEDEIENLELGPEEKTLFRQLVSGLGMQNTTAAFFIPQDMNKEMDLLLKRLEGKKFSKEFLDKAHIILADFMNSYPMLTSEKFSKIVDILAFEGAVPQFKDITSEIKSVLQSPIRIEYADLPEGKNGTVEWTDKEIIIILSNSARTFTRREQRKLHLHEMLHPFILPLFEVKEFQQELENIYTVAANAFFSKELPDEVLEIISKKSSIAAAFEQIFSFERLQENKVRQLNEFVTEFLSGTNPVYWLLSNIKDTSVKGKSISLLEKLVAELKTGMKGMYQVEPDTNLANKLETLLDDTIAQAKVMNGISLAKLKELRPMIGDDFANEQFNAEIISDFEDKPLDTQRSNTEELSDQFMVNSGVIVDSVQLYTNYDSQYAESLSVDVTNLNRMIDEVAFILGYNTYGVSHYDFIQSLSYEEFAGIFNKDNLNKISTPEGKYKAKRFIELLDRNLDYEHTVEYVSQKRLRDAAIRNIYVNILSLAESPHYSITNEEPVIKSKSIEAQIEAVERSLDKEGARLVKLGSRFKVDTESGKITRSSYRYKTKLIDHTLAIGEALGIDLELSFINDFFGNGFHYKNQSLFESDEFDPKFVTDAAITSILGKDSNTAKVAKLIYSSLEFPGLYLLPFADKSTYPFWKVNLKNGETMNQLTERVIIPIYKRYLDIFKADVTTFDPNNKTHYPYIAAMTARLLVTELQYGNTIAEVMAGKTKLTGRNFIEIMKRHTPVIELRTLDYPEEIVTKLLRNNLISTKPGSAYFWGKLGKDTENTLYVKVAIAAIQNDDRFKNKTGQFIFDGQSLYILGEFDEVNKELSGSINDGVLKNVMLFQGLFGKHTLQGINKNEPLAKQLFGTDIAVIIPDANEKNSKGVTRTIKDAEGNEVAIDNTYDDFINGNAKSFYIKFDDFHRIQETHNNKTTAKGSQQIFNSSGLTAVNPVVSDKITSFINKVTKNIGQKYSEKYLDDFNLKKEFVSHLLSVINSPQGNKQKLLSIMFNDLGRQEGILTEGKVEKIFEQIKYFNQMPLLYDAMADYLGKDVTSAVKYEMAGSGLTISGDGGNFFAERVAIAKSQQKEFILKDREAFNKMYPDFKNKDAYYGNLQKLFELQKEIDYFNYMADTLPVNAKYRAKAALAPLKAEKKVLIDSIEKSLQENYDGFVLPSGAYDSVNDLYSKIMPPGFAEKSEAFVNSKFNQNFDERGFLKADGVYISEDKARSLKVRVGDYAITEITPSDSGMGMKGVLVAGILPHTHINPSTIIMNSEYVQGVGKDFDADKMAFIVYSKEMGVTREEWEDFAKEASNLWEKYVNKVYSVFSDLGLVPKGLTNVYDKMRAAFNGETQTAYMKNQLGEKTDVKTFYSPIDPSILYLCDVFHKDVGYVVTLRQLHQLLADIGLKFNLLDSKGKVYKTIDFTNSDTWFKSHIVMMILTNHQVDYPKTIDKDYYNHSKEHIFSNMLGIDYESVPKEIQRSIRAVQNAVSNALNLFMNVPREGSKSYTDSYGNTHYISKTQNSIYKLSEAGKFDEIINTVRINLEKLSSTSDVVIKEPSTIQYPIKSMLSGLNDAFTKANSLLPYVGDTVRKEFMKNVENNILLNMIFNAVDENNNKLFPITSNVLNLFRELEESPSLSRVITTNSKPTIVDLSDPIFRPYTLEERNLGIRYLYALRRQYINMREKVVLGDRIYFDDKSEYRKWAQNYYADNSSKFKDKRYHLLNKKRANGEDIPNSFADFDNVLPLLNKQDAFIEAWYEWNLNSAYQANKQSPEYLSQKKVMNLWRALHFLFTGESELTRGGRAADKVSHHIEYAKQREHLVNMLDVVLNKTNRFVFSDVTIKESEDGPYVTITSFKKGNKIQYYNSEGKLIKESATLRGNPEAYKLIHNPAVLTIDPALKRETSIARSNREQIDSGIPLNFAPNITMEEKMQIAVSYIKQYVEKTAMTKSELNRVLIGLLGVKTDPEAGKNLFIPNLNIANDNLYILMGIFAPDLLFHYRDLYVNETLYNVNVEDIKQQKQNRAGFFYATIISEFEEGTPNRILEIAENEIPATENISKFKKLSYDEKVKEILSLAAQVDILKTARAMGTAVEDLVTSVRNDIEGFTQKILQTQSQSVVSKLEEVENETIRKDKVLNMVYRELTELKTTYKTVPLIQEPGTIEQWRADGKYDLALAWKYDIPEFNAYTDPRKSWMFAIPNYEGWFSPQETDPSAFFSLTPSNVIADISAYAFQESESGLRQFGAIALTAGKFKRLSLQLSALQREVNTIIANRDFLIQDFFKRAVDRTDIAQFESRIRDWERKLIRDNNFSVAPAGKGYKLFYKVEDINPENNQPRTTLIVKREDELDSFIEQFIVANGLSRADEDLKLILKGAIATRVLYNHRIPTVITRTLFFLDHIGRFASTSPYYQDIQILKAKYKRYRYYLLTNAEEDFEFNVKTRKKNFFLKVYQRDVFIKEYQNYHRAERMVKKGISKEEANAELKREAELKIGTEEFYIPFFKDFKDSNLNGDLKQFAADGIFVDKIIQTIGNDIRSIYAMQFLDYATKNRLPKVAVESMKRFMRKQTSNLRFTTKLKDFEDIKEGDHIYFYSMPEQEIEDDIDDLQNEVQGKLIVPALKRGKVISVTSNTIRIEGDEKTYSRDNIYGVDTTSGPQMGYVMEYDPKKITERIQMKEAYNMPLNLKEVTYSKVVHPLYKGLQYAAGKLTLGHWLVKPGFWLFNSLGGYLQMAMYMSGAEAYKAVKGVYKAEREKLSSDLSRKENIEIINKINSVSGYGNTVLNILGQSSDIDTSPEALAYFATTAKTKETKKRLRLFNIGTSDKNLINYHRAMKESPEYKQVQGYIESKRDYVDELVARRETATPDERVQIEAEINTIKDYIAALVNNTYLTEQELEGINDAEFIEMYKIFQESKDIKFYMPYELKTLKRLVKKYKQDKESKSEAFFSINRLEARLRGDAFYLGYRHAKEVVGLEHGEALEYAMNFVDHTQGFYADFARRINEDSEGRKVYYALHQFTLNMIRSLRILHRDAKYNVLLNGLESYVNLYSDIAVDKEGKIVPITKNRADLEKKGGKVIGRNYGMAALNMLWVNGVLFGAGYYVSGLPFLIHPALAPFMILGKILIDLSDAEDKEPKENDVWMMILQFLSLKMGYGGSFIPSSIKGVATAIEEGKFEPLQWVIPKTPRVGMSYIEAFKEDREGKTYANDKFMVLLKTFTRLGVTPKFGSIGISDAPGIIVPYYPDVRDYGKTTVEKKIEAKVKSKERNMQRKEDIMEDMKDYMRYKQGLPKRRVFGLDLY